MLQGRKINIRGTTLIAILDDHSPTSNKVSALITVHAGAFYFEIRKPCSGARLTVQTLPIRTTIGSL